MNRDVKIHENLLHLLIKFLPCTIGSFVKVLSSCVFPKVLFVLTFWGLRENWSWGEGRLISMEIGLLVLRFFFSLFYMYYDWS